MRVLLDTHVFLWLAADPGQLSTAALDRLADPETVLLLSAASGWEISIKYGLGRLPLPEPPAAFLPSRLVAMGIQELPVSMTAAAEVASLPAVHRDPFDRLLVAQARVDGLTLATADRHLTRYDVDTLPVRASRAGG